MDRPALKRLLADVESGVANCVVVYKVDRLTRSLLDFSRIIEILDKNNATFVSVTQQFNTTTSLGRLTLNILLSFAQFEREMISERTHDKMAAARRRGKWVGGNPVLGYDVAPQGGSLVVNEGEAQRVREIFALYLELGSLIPVVEELDRRGWRMKEWTTRDGRMAGGKPIAKNNLYNLLTNMIYLGKVKYGGEVYEGEHARIVDDEIWNQVQTTLNRNGRHGGRNIGNKHGALLKSLVRCATCDVGMIHTYVQKKTRVYRYYVCVKAHQRGWAQCETRCVSAPALESAVLQQLRGIGANPTIMRNVLRQIEEHRRQRRFGGIEGEGRRRARVAEGWRRDGQRRSAGDAGSARDLPRTWSNARTACARGYRNSNSSWRQPARSRRSQGPRDGVACVRSAVGATLDMGTGAVHSHAGGASPLRRQDRHGDSRIPVQRDQGLVQLGASHQGEIRACTTARLRFNFG